MEASWKRLGPSWKRLKPSWRRLRGRLGASWARLGRRKSVIFLWFFQCFCIPRPHWHNLASASVSKASWASLGNILGASWARLGRLGVVLGASWDVLGAAWGHLGASWGRLGASWARFGKRKNIIFPWFFSMFLRSSASLAQTCLSFRLEGVLGASWEHLGRVLGPSWTVMVASWGVLWPSWAVM